MFVKSSKLNFNYTWSVDNRDLHFQPCDWSVTSLILISLDVSELLSYPFSQHSVHLHS